VLHHPVRGDNDAAGTLVALMHGAMEQFGGGVGDAPRKEEVVED